jgi:hypothetical protein
MPKIYHLIQISLTHVLCMDVVGMFKPHPTPRNSLVSTKLSRNIFQVPKIKKVSLNEMKFLVPNYSRLENPWIGGYRLQLPHSLCPQLNLMNPTPPQPNSWVCHCMDVKHLYPPMQGKHKLIFVCFWPQFHICHQNSSSVTMQIWVSKN